MAVLVNGLGSTTLMEQYIAFRRVRRRLDELGTTLHRSMVGSHVTSPEMGGLSPTLLDLGDELAALVDHPAVCAMFAQSQQAS